MVDDLLLRLVDAGAGAAVGAFGMFLIYRIANGRLGEVVRVLGLIRHDLWKIHRGVEPPPAT